MFGVLSPSATCRVRIFKRESEKPLRISIVTEKITVKDLNRNGNLLEAVSGVERPRALFN